MKKGSKVFLSIAIALFLIGIAIVAIALAFGGQNLIQDLAAGKGNVNFGNLSVGNLKTPKIYLDLDDWESDEGMTYFGDQSKFEVAKADEIQGLSMEIGAAKLELRTSQDDAFWLETRTNGEVKCYVESGVLYLKGVKNDAIHSNSKIVLFIPGDVELKRIALDLGAGKAECEELIADEISMDIGAGQVEIETLKCDTLSTDLGAGQVTFDNSEVKEGTFSVSMGELLYQGAIQGDVDAECAMGNMEFDLAGGEDEFNYRVECAAGSVTIGDKMYSNLASDMTMDKNAEKDFSIDCAMGNIELDFEK